MHSIYAWDTNDYFNWCIQLNKYFMVILNDKKY